MIIRSVLTTLVLGLATLAIAGPPGILDGENIPTDFAGNLEATQRNSTQFGDYFVTPGLLSPGNETDQLLVAKSIANDALHIGITGNLATNGNIWLIGINIPGRVGQTENRTEGTGLCGFTPDGGPPWTVQASSIEVVIDDATTPADDTDDTYTFGATGMIFPTDTDYLFAVDAFSGNMSVNRYILHEVDGTGIGLGWDPTPGNVGDVLAPLYAERDGVASGATNDGDDILDSAVGMTVGGFDNTNILGVTETDGSTAATATTGLELAIPFSLMPVSTFPDVFLDGTEEIEVYVLLVDGVEGGCVGDAFGHVVNQVLPPLAAGPPCDNDTGLVGFRTDLTTSMGVVTVDLNALSSFGGVADGVIVLADYDTEVGVLQTCPTHYGDQFFDNSAFDRGAGSELDALYVTSDELNLYVGITGNLEENGNKLQIWIDNGIGVAGEHFLTWDGMGDGGSGMEGDAMPPLADTTTDALFDYAVSINVQGPATDPDRQVFVDFWDIIGQISTFKGASIRESGNGDLDTTGGASNQWGMQVALNNLNTAGVLGCQPFVDPCWFDDNATVEALAASVTSGFEIAIPLADIGINPCDGPATIHLWAHVTSADGFRSNQALPSVRPETGNPDSTEQVQNLGAVVTDWFQDAVLLPEEFARAVTVTHVTTPGAVVNDCDSSGTEDVCDILDDPSIDLDFSGVPDVCEIVTCTVVEDCADPLGNGVTDDVCTWWACDAGICVATQLTDPSDMGGAFGACPPDNFCNLADALHALTCFASTNTCDGVNIDAGGAFGGCTPDGFCNLADALHALTCFQGTNACGCAPSPESQQPNVVGATDLTAVADRRAIKAGGEVQVSVFVDEPLDNLLGYQLETAVSGGRSGSFELVDITVEGRYDAVYARTASPFEAFNVENSQMLAGNFAGAIETNAYGYLATFTYRVSDDALGTFVIDVLHGESNQTMLVGAEQTDKIEISGTTPAVVVVTSDRPRSVR